MTPVAREEGGVGTHSAFASGTVKAKGSSTWRFNNVNFQMADGTWQALSCCSPIPLIAIIIGRGLVAWHSGTADGTEVAAGLTFGVKSTEAAKASSSKAAKRRLEKSG